MIIIMGRAGVRGKHYDGVRKDFTHPSTLSTAPSAPSSLRSSKIPLLRYLCPLYPNLVQPFS